MPSFSPETTVDDSQSTPYLISVALRDGSHVCRRPDAKATPFGVSLLRHPHRSSPLSRPLGLSRDRSKMGTSLARIFEECEGQETGWPVGEHHRCCGTGRIGLDPACARFPCPSPACKAIRRGSPTGATQCSSVMDGIHDVGISDGIKI